MKLSLPDIMGILHLTVRVVSRVLRTSPDAIRDLVTSLLRTIVAPVEVGGIYIACVVS